MNFGNELSGFPNTSSLEISGAASQNRPQISWSTDVPIRGLVIRNRGAIGKWPISLHETRNMGCGSPKAAKPKGREIWKSKDGPVPKNHRVKNK